MKKALEILKEIMGNKLLYFQLAKQDFSLMKINEAIAELEAFEKECKNLVIESKRLVNETLDLSEIIVKQNKRIAELEEEKLNRREWYQKGYNEAMKQRTCEGCKYLDIAHTEKAWCKHYDLNSGFIRPIYRTFCCNRYEPKDKQC